MQATRCSALNQWDLENGEKKLNNQAVYHNEESSTVFCDGAQAVVSTNSDGDEQKHGRSNTPDP